ncbi:uncharacterized protein LOC135389277 [Ornithodoros turicata]|uniref:uncharacterized protein LOC135389277 n=1 Tax=Ornithodoros turicata TaxID=34597 RepID=UPI003138986E
MLAAHLSADVPRQRRQTRRGGAGGYARPEVPENRDFTGGPDYGSGPGVTFDDAAPARDSQARPQGPSGHGGHDDGSYDHSKDHGDHGEWRLEDAIPGTPESDYPTFTTIPETSFDCKAQQFQHAGYFADVEARCQVFHICQEDGRHDKFLCPVGTIFNQKYFVCDWWKNVDCNEATSYYNLNDELYKETGPTQQHHGSQGGSQGAAAPAPRPAGQGPAGGGVSDFGTRPQTVPGTPQGSKDYGQDYEAPERGYGGGGRRRGSQAQGSELSQVYYWDD